LGPEKTSGCQARDFVFFEEGLLSPTLDDPLLQPVDEDEQVTPPTLDHNTSPTTLPDTANVWAENFWTRRQHSTKGTATSERKKQPTAREMHSH